MSPFSYAFAQYDESVYSQEIIDASGTDLDSQSSISGWDQWDFSSDSGASEQDDSIVSGASENDEDASEWQDDVQDSQQAGQASSQAPQNDENSSEWQDNVSEWEDDVSSWTEWRILRDEQWDTEDSSADASEWHDDVSSWTEWRILGDEQWDTQDSSAIASEWQANASEWETDDVDYTVFKSVAWLANYLWIDWDTESEDYAVLAGIARDDYEGTTEQNQLIKSYILNHIEDIKSGNINNLIEEAKALENEQEDTQDEAQPAEQSSSQSAEAGANDEDDQQAKTDNHISVLDDFFHFIGGAGNSASSNSLEVEEENLEQAAQNDVWNTQDSSSQAPQNDSETTSEWQTDDVDYTAFKSVAWLANYLWIDWENESEDYAVLAGIARDDYVWSVEQNQQIKTYILDHIEDIKSGKIRDIIEDNMSSWTEWEILGDEQWDVQDSLVDASEWQDEEQQQTKTELDIAWLTLNAEPIEKSERSRRNGVTVKVYAPENTFPEGTKAVIEAITSKSDLNKVKDQLGDNVDDDAEVVAFDIRFVYKLSNGEEVEIQPLDNKVQVTFDYSRNSDLKEADKSDDQQIEVYHINDKDENGDKVEAWEEVVEKIEINTEKSDEVKNGVVIDAENFSVYVLTLSDNSGFVLSLDPKWGIFAADANITFPSWCDQENDSSCIWEIVAVSWIVSEPVAPTKSGYNFAGWYRDDGTFADEWDFVNDAVVANITLYAKWEWDYNDLELYFLQSDWTITHYTIMDRNMWATEVYNQDWNNQNTGSYGYYYEWWNNNWFLDGYTYQAMCGYSFSSSWSNNRQWPCPTWYQIRNEDEFMEMESDWEKSKQDLTYTWIDFSSDWLLPFAGRLSYEPQQQIRNLGNTNYGYFWTSSWKSDNERKASSIMFSKPSYFDSSSSVSVTDAYCYGGLSIRCVKNTKNPDNTLTINADGW